METTGGAALRYQLKGKMQLNEEQLQEFCSQWSSSWLTGRLSGYLWTLSSVWPPLHSSTE